MLNTWRLEASITSPIRGHSSFAAPVHNPIAQVKRRLHKSNAEHSESREITARPTHAACAAHAT